MNTLALQRRCRLWINSSRFPNIFPSQVSRHQRFVTHPPKSYFSIAGRRPQAHGLCVIQMQKISLDLVRFGKRPDKTTQPGCDPPVKPDLHPSSYLRSCFVNDVAICSLFKYSDTISIHPSIMCVCNLDCEDKYISLIHTKQGYLQKTMLCCQSEI